MVLTCLFLQFALDSFFFLFGHGSAVVQSELISQTVFTTSCKGMFLIKAVIVMTSGTLKLIILEMLQLEPVVFRSRNQFMCFRLWRLLDGSNDFRWDLGPDMSPHLFLFCASMLLVEC